MLRQVIVRTWKTPSVKTTRPALQAFWMRLVSSPPLGARVVVAANAATGQHTINACATAAMAALFKNKRAL
jgi:hypothetical protein